MSGCISEQSCDRCRNDIDHQLDAARSNIDTHTEEIKELTVIVAKVTQLLESQTKTNEAMEKRIEMLEKAIIDKSLASQAEKAAEGKRSIIEMLLTSKPFMFFITAISISILAITLSAVGQGSVKDLVPQILNN